MHKRFLHAFLLLLCIPGVLLARLPAARHSYAAHHKFHAALAGQPVTICSGAPIVIQGESTVFTPDTYSWEVLQGNNWVNAPGVNNAADYQSSLLINNTPANIIFNIRRKITKGSTVVYDSFYDVEVQPASPIANNTITAPATASFCSSGTPSTITGSTPTGGNGNFLYQWQSSSDNITFTNITGANAKDYAPPLITSTTYYRRMVSAGSCVVAAPSNTVAILIHLPITNNNVTTPAISSFCTGGDPAVIAGSTPAGGDGIYNYQWQSSTDNNTFTNITGATSKDYDPPVITVTTYYRRLTTSGSCTAPNVSNTATITIAPPLAGNTITAPPVASFCVNGDATAITGSTPTGGNGTYSYQWQSSNNNTSFTDIPGATAKDYDPPAINTTTYYRRLVTSGSCTTPLISSAVAINILSIPTAPVLTAPPTVTICPGSTATFAVNAQPGITYNWYDSATKNNLLFTGNTFTTPALNASSTFYVEGSNGSCTSTALTTAQVVVATPPAAPTVAPVPVQCSGNVVTLSITGAQPGVTYQWYATATGGNTLGTGVNFTTPVLTANTTYYAGAINTTGCTAASRTPVTVTIDVPQVTVQGTSVCPGNSTTLTASATGVSNASYRWYATHSGGAALFTGSTFTTPVLNANTNYYVEVTNNATGCTSARQPVTAQMLQPLPTPQNVRVSTTTLNSVTFTWDATPGATGYEVSTDNGQTYAAPSSGNGLTHTLTGLQPNQTVTLLVRATGNTSCELSESTAATGIAQVRFDNPADAVYVPNAFTPNGDGRNDQVHVHSELVKTLAFYVYSQWGELLFTTTDMTRGWDGTYKGTLQPVGVYIYTLKATLNDGQQVNKKGTITLLR